MATNSSITEYGDYIGSESDKSDKMKSLNQATINTLFKIIPKNWNQGRTPKPKKTELSPNYNQQDLDSPSRKMQQRGNIECITDINWPFVKEALKFPRKNRNSTAIERGMMSSETECIPLYNIYSIENLVRDCVFQKKNCFKEREIILDTAYQQLLQDMIVNLDCINTGMT